VRTRSRLFDSLVESAHMVCGRSGAYQSLAPVVRKRRSSITSEGSASVVAHATSRRSADALESITCAGRRVLARGTIAHLLRAIACPIVCVRQIDRAADELRRCEAIEQVVAEALLIGCFGRYRNGRQPPVPVVEALVPRAVSPEPSIRLTERFVRR